LHCIKGALALFVLVSFFWLRVLDKADYSAFQSTLNSPIVSYRNSKSQRKLSVVPYHKNTIAPMKLHSSLYHFYPTVLTVALMPQCCVCRRRRRLSVT